MDKTVNNATREHLHEAFDLPRHWIVVPRPVRVQSRRHPVLRSLLPSHVGFFPKARHHQVQRPVGVEQTIFNYCVAGAGFCEVEGRRFSVRAGDLMVIPRQTPHAYGTSQDKPWTLHWFHAEGEHLDSLLAALGVREQAPIVYLGQSTKLIELMEELRGVLEQDYSSQELLYASQLLTHVVGLMIRLRRASHRESPGANQRVLESLQSMKRGLDEPLSVVKLARLASLSPSHYSALFRKLTGSSPHQYLTRLRIHHAARLLATTEHPVRVVAARVGYSDPLHFSRAFRLVNRLSPSAFRQSLRSEWEKADGMSLERRR